MHLSIYSILKFFWTNLVTKLTLSWRGSLSYRNQSIDLQSKSVDWFLYDNGLRHERVNISTARSSNLDKIKEIRARTEQFKHSFFPFALMNGTSWIN